MDIVEPPRPAPREPPREAGTRIDQNLVQDLGPPACESAETRELAEQIDRLTRASDLLPAYTRAALAGLRAALAELRLRERIEWELIALAATSAALRSQAAEALRERIRRSLLPDVSLRDWARRDLWDAAEQQGSTPPPPVQPQPGR